jgi:hypothetical protein
LHHSHKNSKKILKMGTSVKTIKHSCKWRIVACSHKLDGYIIQISCNAQQCSLRRIE